MKIPVFLASFAAVYASTANAHGRIIEPAPTFKPNVNDVDYVGLIDSSSLGAPFKGGVFNKDPDTNANSFTQAFKRLHPYLRTLQLLTSRVGGECGNTVTDGNAVDVTGRKDLKWGHPSMDQGFTRSHSGPCEVWINNTRVLYEDNCVKKYPGVPASVPVDFSKCKGTCILKFYWLPVHEPKWHVHKNCVKIKNSVSA